MSSKDEKNLSRVLDKIAAMDEPRRSVMQQVHDIIMAAAPDLEAQDLVRDAGLRRLCERPGAGDAAQ